MQGEGVVTKYEYNGSDHRALAAYRDGIRFTFTGGRMTCSVGNEVRSTWDVELSPSSVPRAFTKTRSDKLFVMKGIYRFEGAELIVCEDQRGTQPTEFDSKGGRYLIVMKRR
jgi:uncharacterized protein (TIGR03067 family)